MVSEFIRQVKINQKTDANCYVKYGLEPLKEPRNIRIKFSKTGSLQYISHLDLQRLWNRIIIRAGIPIWYTEGFNPHPKMIFALPLPVGVESVCEYLDIKITKDISASDIKELISEETPKELEIIDVYTPERKFSEIAKAQYIINLKAPYVSPEFAEKVNDFFGKDQPIYMNKHTKSGEKEIDIRRLIFEVNAKFVDNSIKIEAVCAAGTESLNPEFIMSSMKKYGIIKPVPLNLEEYSIMRQKVFTQNSEQFN